MATPKSYETRDFLYSLATFLVSLLPLGVVRGLGSFAGKAMWVLAPGRRKMATEAVAFHLDKDTSEAARIARASFSNSFISFFEPIKRFDLNYRYMKDNVEIRDPERMKMLRESPQPMVSISGHIGCWEFLSQSGSFVFANKPKVMVYRTLRDDDMNRTMTRLRERPTIKYVGHREAASFVNAFLKEPFRIAAFLVDHNTLLKEAIFLPFLNDIAAVNRGPAMLAVRAKAMIVPYFLIRRPGRKMLFCCEEPLDTRELTGTIRDKVAAAAEFYTRAVEQYVRLYPEQWHWMHRRWKTRPEDSQN